MSQGLLCNQVYRLIRFVWNKYLLLRDVNSYLTLKKKIQLWKTFMDPIPKKQAPAICLFLSGNTRKAELQLLVEIFNSHEGVTELMKTLDILYVKDKDQIIYEAYDEFENLYDRLT